MVKQKVITLLDTKYFTTTEGATWVHDKLSRPFNLERGLVIPPNEDAEVGVVLATIEKFNWQKFVEDPGPVAPTLVREFYGNIDLDKNTSIVRGKPIPFSPDTINALYKTPDVDDKKLQDLLDVEEIAKPLCPNGVHWILLKSNEKNGFPIKNLSKKANIWFIFLNSRLEPNKNTSEVRMRRAVWLLALVQEYDINVGRTICGNIRKCRTDSAVKSFYHCSTITKLIEIFGNVTIPQNGLLFSSVIGKDTLRALGHCIGPKNETINREQRPCRKRRKTPPKRLTLESKVDLLLSEVAEIKTVQATFIEKYGKALKDLMGMLKNSCRNISTQNLQANVFHSMELDFLNTGLQDHQDTNANGAQRFYQTTMQPDVSNMSMNLGIAQVFSSGINNLGNSEGRHTTPDISEFDMSQGLLHSLVEMENGCNQISNVLPLMMQQPPTF